MVGSRLTTYLPLVTAGLAIATVVAWAAWIPAIREPDASSVNSVVAPELAPSVRVIDQYFETLWQSEGLQPALPTDDLQVLRRLSLALHGTIPSLQEIRRFEADRRRNRLSAWTAEMLDDRRFAEYFAERFARTFVGVDEGQFIVFRRDRFVDWLAEQLASRRPYDELVREMIAGGGLWTGEPETNFITATAVEGEIDENKLAGRSVRAFLGQRIDCAQCHDHPFADWKQRDFEGLAAWFGQTRLTLAGVEDRTHDDRRQPLEFTVDDPAGGEPRVVPPSVPFADERLPNRGTRRARFAAWITHRENRRFERAIANRMWGLMFGRPWHEPVDDLPDPPEDGTPDLLDLLGEDFRTHGYDLRRMIQVIAASRPFRLDSQHAADTDEGDPKQVARLIDGWAIFPVTQLRPEQIIGAMLQASSLKTIDRNSHLVVRAIRFFRERDFVERYGDLGEEELEQHSATIPQALLRMNGKLANEILQVNPFTAGGRMLAFSEDEDELLEACFLVCLTRRPTSAERRRLVASLADDTDREKRQQAMEDLSWSLFNSVEFSWNH